MPLSVYHNPAALNQYLWFTRPDSKRVTTNQVYCLVTLVRLLPEHGPVVGMQLFFAEVRVRTKKKEPPYWRYC